jgi:hypothetical protein
MYKIKNNMYIYIETCIVMEDMAKYKSPPQMPNLSEERCISGVKNMSILHGIYWGSKMKTMKWINGSKNREQVWLGNLVLGTNGNNNFNKAMQKFSNGKALAKAVKKYCTPLGEKLWQEFSKFSNNKYKAHHK